MYYTNISNQELQYFHNLKVHNFTIKLTDVLSSALFKVEEIITDSIFKVYPLFYTTEITSSNSDDRILDNKCIICQKITDTETYLTFISVEGEEIVDYSNYADYYTIGDQLTTSQFNSYISLLRHNTVHTDTIKIGELVTGEYGNYHFDIEGSTILDNGIVVTDETITAQPKVKLTDNVFHYSTYTLKLSILHYTGVNILDDITPTNNIVVDTLEIELTPNTWIDIPLDDIEQGYIIDFDSTIEIKHNKTEIHHINGLQLTATQNIIQTNETTDITAQLLDTDNSNYNLNDCAGKTIHFYEQITGTIQINATKTIIQSGDTTDITAKVRDEDGSIPKNMKVYFYEEEE